jgi:predicted nucleic acid-binding protein
MHVFDASSVIYAWDNYPITQFPPVWKWMAMRIEDGEFTIPRVGLSEVERKTPDCAKWLKGIEIPVLDLDAAVLREALRIKHLLGIAEDAYHPKGVGEVDILIIATASLAGATLVSDEAKQFNLPNERARYKIPAVCNLPEVATRCISFVELIKRSETVFE